MFKVYCVALEQMLATSLSLPMEMLHAAERYTKFSGYKHAEKSTKGEPFCPPLSIELLYCQDKIVTSSGGMKIACDIPLVDSTVASLIILPALWRNPIPTIINNPELMTWLSQQHLAGATIIAAGTGVCLLAETGLLDHQAATTHWYYFDKFAKRYPKVLLQRNHFITRAGQLYCAGSVNSVADLMVHLIENFYSKSIAMQVEQQFSQEIRRSYSSTYFTLNEQKNINDETVVEVQEYLQNNLSVHPTLIALAKRFDMSSRTLSRRFKAATGQSPQQFGLQVRMENAKELLRHSDLAINNVADRVGFSDEAYFTRQFKRYSQCTPSEFRRAVRSKLFSLDS